LGVDNSSTHKTPSSPRWLVRHPRFTLHFTPTYSSWLNLVERWFGPGCAFVDHIRELLRGAEERLKPRGGGPAAVRSTRGHLRARQDGCVLQD
jgi:hypothetical protein